MTKQTILPLSSLPNFNGFSPHQPVNGIHTPFSHAQHTQTHHHPHSCECTHIHPKASHQQQQLAAHAEFVLSSVFSLELLIRLLAYHSRAFLQSSWNVLDLVLVMTSFIAVCLEASPQQMQPMELPISRLSSNPCTARGDWALYPEDLSQTTVHPTE